jgi:acyl carrier protein
MTMEEQVRSVVAQVLEVPVDSVHAESSPDSIATWDSLKHMNLVLALEQSFGVTFSDEQIAEMMSVELIIATLKEFS